jgi:tight adherence protein B
MENLEIYLYGAILLAVILLIHGLFYFFGDMKKQKGHIANRRARLLAKGLTQDQTLRKLHRERLTVNSGKLEEKRSWTGLLARLDHLLDESGVTISTTRYLVITGVITLTVTVLVAIGGDMPVICSFVFGLFVGFALPLLYIMRKKAVKLRRLSEQVPDTIDMIVRSVRAGHPIRTAFNLVAKEMPDPMGTEFGILVDEMTYGLDLTEALENFQRRNDLQDIHYFSVTVNVQHGTGGNLAEVLANLASVIRDRFRTYKKIRVLSAEGRLAASIIAVVPFFTAFIMTINKPSYYTEAAKSEAFPIVMAVALVLYLGSMFVIYKIVRIRV